MTLRQYQKIRLFIVVVLAIIFSQAIVLKNYLIPIATMVAGSLILILIRRRVSEVIADERDYATGGRAALLAIQIYGWIGAVGMFIFYALRDRDSVYEPIAMTLAFSTVALLMLYGLIFRIIQRHG